MILSADLPLILTSWASRRTVIRQSSKIAVSTPWMISSSIADWDRPGIGAVSTDLRLHLNWQCHCLASYDGAYPRGILIISCLLSIDGLLWFVTILVIKPDHSSIIHRFHFHRLLHLHPCNRKCVACSLKFQPPVDIWCAINCFLCAWHISFEVPG